ncbi:flagellar filament capping protein FliD [bacterium]|nr:flagellar filament capping protein FliD [bacterium]
MGSITFTGLASGMDTSSWIDALVQIKSQNLNTLNTKKTETSSSKSMLSAMKSNFSSLDSAIGKFTDSKFGGAFDVFAKNTVSSSNDDTVSATVSADAIRQSVQVVVEKLASSTVATSNLCSNGLINENTVFNKLASGKATDGDFSIFVNGEKHVISTKKDPTLDDSDDKELAAQNSATIGTILDRINEIDGVHAEIVGGKISITGRNEDDSTNSIVVGASTDKSNFVSVMNLVRSESGTEYESFSTVSAIDLNSTLVDMFGESVKGTLTIGNQEFTINENTTFKNFIADINSKSEAGTSAYWDASKSELVLTSKVDGAFNINIESGTSDLTDLLGFTQSSIGEGDVKQSKLVEGTQTLGDYASLTINGSRIISSSNTVTSDISGIEGLTLNLKSVSKENDEGELESVKIDVAQDTTAFVDAVKSFINAFNTTIEKVDANTSYGSKLYGETSLTSLRNNLRKIATYSNGEDNAFKLLSDIGITTATSSDSTDTSGINKLQLDEEKLKDALAKDPAAVKKLLVGDNKGNSDSGGIFNKMKKITDTALDSSNGYFVNKTKSYEKSIKDLESSISREQTKIDSYKARLEKQFNNMEQIISSMQASYSFL